MSGIERTESSNTIPATPPIEAGSQPDSQESVAAVAQDHFAEAHPAGAPAMPPITSFTRTDSTVAVNGSLDSNNADSQPVEPSYDGTETSQNS